MTVEEAMDEILRQAQSAQEHWHDLEGIMENIDQIERWAARARRACIEELECESAPTVTE